MSESGSNIGLFVCCGIMLAPLVTFTIGYVLGRKSRPYVSQGQAAQKRVGLPHWLKVWADEHLAKD